MKRVILLSLIVMFAFSVYSTGRPIKVLRWGTYTGKDGSGVPICVSSTDMCVIVYAIKEDLAIFTIHDVYYEDPEFHNLIEVQSLGEINMGSGTYGITKVNGIWTGPLAWTTGTWAIEYLD